MLHRRPLWREMNSGEPMRCETGSVSWSAAQIFQKILVAVAIVLSMCAPVSARQVTVFAAASLKGALDEIAAEFQRKTGDLVQLSFAGSSVLARQIILGAPADVFLSASPQWMDVVAAEGLLAAEGRFEFTTNRLALITSDPTVVPAQEVTAQTFHMLGPKDRISVALVDAVPAGQYAQAALRSLGAWTDTQARLLQTDNVRSALALVALGEARFGIVYDSDLWGGSNVTRVGLFPAASHPEIRYPAAAIGNDPDAAVRAFLTFLKGPQAQMILRQHGFSRAGRSPGS